MESLLVSQQHIVTAMQVLLSNFKKDGQDRKTADYIKRRVDILDGYWCEFDSNHIKLCAVGDESLDYFTGDNYNKTREMYQNIREIITKALPLIRPATPLSNLAQQDPQPGVSKQTLEEPKFKSVGLNSKLDEMLKKQTSYFKAFAHTVENINIDHIKEKWEFEDVLRNLQARWSAIDTLHWELDSELDDKDKSYQITFSEYEQKFNNMKKLINANLWTASHREKSTPQMDIPIFHGNYHQWVCFKDLFTEAIHNNHSLSNAQKMQFLKSKVKGEAERLIQHLHISTDNYDTCWDILNHRYNNKKLIFTSHTNILLSLPVVQQASINHIKRIHDTTLECLNAIKNLGVDVKSWDPLLVHILSQKLDSETHNEYMSSLHQPRELPTLQEFLDFLESKFTTMESSRRKQEVAPQKSVPHPSSSGGKFQKFHHHNNHTYSSNKNITQPKHAKVFQYNKVSCPICKNDHGIYFCKQFLDMTPVIRRQAVAKYNLCINCLFDHNGKICVSNKRCRDCQGCHNTMLHEAFAKSPCVTSRPPTSNNNSVSQQVQPAHSNSNVAQQQDVPEILLATAIIRVLGADGTYQTMRTLIDQGSQASLITENAVQRLGLPRQRCKGVITGVGAKDNNCKGIISINCKSNTDEYSFSTEAYIMKSLTRNLPHSTFQKPSWDYLANIQLADPEFYISRPIDLLLGADVYPYIILEGICRADQSSLSSPVAQQTRLGWILCGNVKTLQCNVVLNNIDEIQKFWQMEDISEETALSSEEKECVKFFKTTTRRLADGKYRVRLPLKTNFENHLGKSRPMATAQFNQLEKKFKRQEHIAKQYKLFIQEYLTLGHMKPATGNQTPTDCYMPHHCVLRNDSISSALRVVFNASAQTSSGASLNDVMYKGPNLQQDLQSLILKWRQYKYAFIADIEKMFRQIWMNEADQSLQKIVWRDFTNESLRDYQLTTVTYGTKAAPFLAMMTLKQLASDERDSYPEAAKVLEDSFYMDDVLHGDHYVELAKKLQHELSELLKAGGFNLRKWMSNNSELIKDQTQQQEFNFKQADTTKTLGLRWEPTQDVFKFQANTEYSNSKTTKRALLSDISKLFDPLGWLTPISTKLKLLFQKVWMLKLEWDDHIPEQIKTEWLKIKSDLENINQFQIPRWLGIEQASNVELHGYSDASIRAFACVIYCKINKGNETSVTMVMGKARLVPSSKTISLPRLELSGALLLARTMNKIKQCLVNYNIRIYGWIDSMAVLGWLQGDPGRWKSFVSNRVRQITEVMPPDCWRYVKSSENPADCASRGLTPTQLKDHPLWWTGPTWLQPYQDINEKDYRIYTTEEELKRDKQVHLVTQNQMPSEIISNLLSRCSSFTKAVHVLAWVRRVLSSKQHKMQAKPYLSLDEIREAEMKIIKQIQRVAFQEEIKSLNASNKVRVKSKFLDLNPYLDGNGILRVGGRLKHALISPDMKHPIIMPHSGRFTELLIDHAHKLTLHGGARLTLAFSRRKFWIVGGNRATKKHIRRCVICRKQEPSKQYQIMGDLPGARCNASRPFSHTGVDFTGHVYIKASKGRGIKTTKAYVAVFVCMATKAVHLELVSDLSSATFIAALRRMGARRGTPRHLYSDNGTNFVGANRILKQEYQEIQKVFSSEFMAEITDMEHEWHFQAPAWPSANGLFEAAVKSFKFHLKRVIGEQRLTYEEFTTLLAQIEACLNSRPLCALSEDPEDLDYLTPSHFLTGGPSLTLLETERDMRTRWQLTQKIFRDIWKRWRSEYLTQLSARSKWRQPQNNIQINDVALIHDDNSPPGKWLMGKVVDVHPGSDGYIRVVTLKTKNGHMKRPVVKLSILPINDSCVPLAEQSTTQATNKQKRAKHTNKSYNLMSFTTTLLLLITSVTGSYAMSVSKFRDSQSLYFDKLSNMQLIRDEWSLVVYYDMQPYWQGTVAFSNYIKSLQDTCTKIQELASCDVILIQLRHRFTELEYYNQLLLSQHFSARPPIRQRRGLINGIGYLANSLFGVLDERFAEQYQKDIDTLRENQKHVALHVT